MDNRKKKSVEKAEFLAFQNNFISDTFRNKYVLSKYLKEQLCEETVLLNIFQTPRCSC